MTDMKEIVAFFLSGKEYGVEVSHIQGLENYAEIMSFEGTPESILGVVDIRGEAIPVMNIKRKLVLPPVGVTGDTKLVVFSTRRGKLACVADGVSHIFQVEGDGFQNVPQFFQGEKTVYVDFVANIGKRLIIVMNPDRLLTDGEWKSVAKMLTEYREKGNEEEND